MAVQVNLSNGESLTIKQDDHIIAWKGTNDKSKDGTIEYYAEAVYNNNNGPELATADQRVGLQGLFSHSDWFSAGDDPKIYKTSAIVSIED